MSNEYDYMQPVFVNSQSLTLESARILKNMIILDLVGIGHYV